MYHSKVVALGNPAGDLLWISDRLEGECAGTPVISSDGRLVFLTHNSNRSTYGHFSIVSAQGMGRALFSRANTVAPYSPLGSVWNPTLGNFDDNENNQRDVIIWSYAPTPDYDITLVVFIIFEITQCWIPNIPRRRIGRHCIGS